MRDLQPPEGTRIASVDGGSLFDCHIPSPSFRFAPFDTPQDRHRHLRMGMYFDPRLDDDIKQTIDYRSVDIKVVLVFIPLTMIYHPLSTFSHSTTLAFGISTTWPF